MATPQQPNRYHCRCAVPRLALCLVSSFLIQFDSGVAAFGFDCTSGRSPFGTSTTGRLTTQVNLGMASSSTPSEASSTNLNSSFLSTVLFVECGFGNDSHGQDATKAAVRACRNAIEFNSIPSVAKLVPGGYDGLRLGVILAVPRQYQASLDLEQIRKAFPYGQVQFTIQDGGMVAPSGIAIDSLGDTNDDMVVVCAAVSVGY